MENEYGTVEKNANGTVGIVEPGTFAKQAEIRKFETISPEKMKKLNEETEYKSGYLMRFIRIVRDNPDLIVLGIIVIVCCAGGYWLAKIQLGMTSEQIKIQVWDFIEFVGIVLVGVSALIGKLFMTQGTITKALSKSAAKEADVQGRTIVR